MSRNERWLYVVFPIGLFLYLVGLICWLPDDRVRSVLSETGPIEMGTAVLFVLAGVYSIQHVRHHRSQLAPLYRILALSFAAGLFFVALEELSYGQHLFGFGTPEWIEAQNRKGEANLHNLFDDSPSELLRGIGNAGILAGCVVLPLIRRWRGSLEQPGHWSYFLMPGTQIVVFALVAELFTLPRKLPDEYTSGLFLERTGEIKEFYWALSILLYCRIMYNRFEQPLDSGASSGPDSVGSERATSSSSASQEAARRRVA